MNTSTLDAWSAIEKRLSALTSPGAIPGLVFMEKVMNRLGNPLNFPALHIAGTNGKGSTCACLDSMLRQAGYRSALYTSPHLSYLGERLLIDGEVLSIEKWSDAVDALADALAGQDCPLNYFQALTAASFWLIQREDVDAAVIETGLGGRLDATNVLPQPLISVIAPLGMDHMEMLGDTLSKIACEKFGIVKSGCRALYCGGPHELNEQFKERCSDVDAEGEVFSESCCLSDVKSSLDGNSFSLKSPQGERELFVRLAGAYQAENSSLAVRALELISHRLPVAESAVELGLRNVIWPGRMEVLRRAPDLIIDGAHNPHGTRALVRSLLALYGAKRPFSLVYTSMADKDYMESLKLYEEAFPCARIFCTELEGNHRCEKAEKLAEKASSLKWAEAPRVIRDPMDAIRAARQLGDPVIVCGSLYFIGRVRDSLIHDEV